MVSQTEITCGRRDRKKPRLFFSDEQKNALLSAYTRDPYPCQSTIEALARDIEVGVKTVVNWFHNHRMRAKQLPPLHDETFNCVAVPDQVISFKTEVDQTRQNFYDASAVNYSNHSFQQRLDASFL